MNRQPDIQRAINTVGLAEADDWKIEPTTHAGTFNESAPALADVLRRSDVDRIARQYQRHDEEAVEAQKDFKRAAARARRAVAAATVASGLILFIGNFNDLFPADSKYEDITFAIAGAAMIVVGALATMWVNRLRGGNLLERWLQARAEAERRRLEFFDVVIKAAKTEADVGFDLLRLEYVRRFLLDSQLAYFTKRSREHRAEADKTLDWVSWGTCAATVFAGLAGSLAVINPHFTGLAALGVAAAALATVAAQRETVNQDRRNGEQYAATCVRLEGLTNQLTATREAIASGDRTVLANFFAALREVLLAEHTQWLEESKRRSAAIDKLDEVLKQHSNELPAGAAASDVKK